MILREYQQAAVDAAYRHLRERADNPCLVLPTGCHAEGHPILMYDGTVRPVEDVRVGDFLMGPDSQPRTVTALCRGEDELFRIIPHRGEPFVVNGDHVLSLVCTREGKRWPCSRKGGEIDDIRVRDYLRKSRSWRHLRKLYRVPIEFPVSRDLPIPPYILGLLLGDGCLRDGIDLTTADEVLADAWNDYAISIGCETTVKASDRCPIYRLTRGGQHSSMVAEALESLELWGCDSSTKHIPACYLTASRTDRLLLLAGLMDTDGHSSKAGFDYITKSKELATDLSFLAKSLGYAVNCRQKYSTCQTGAGGWYYRLHITGETHEVPCRLRRKRASRRRQKKSPLRTGFRVEPYGHGPFFGFVLDDDHRYVDGNFVVHHNSGKTPVLATLCRDAVTRWHGRVLILAHVKELLEQAVDKLRKICPDLNVGIYSAGLRRRDTQHDVIVAGIQSIYKRACELDAFDLILVDEAHMIPLDGEGMYRQFLADARTVNPHVRVIGLTATPFRLKSGSICVPAEEGGMLNSICYEIGVKELIRDGYLCPLVTKAGIQKADTSGLHVRGGEFIGSEVETLMDQDELVEAACREMVEYTRDRNACLIFASGVAHGKHIVRVLREQHGVECGFISGKTPAAERDELLARFRGDLQDGLFKREPLKYLCNVNVLTTGFDAPNIDCVALVRPTMSPGLYYQMVGRGFRLHPEKADCLVLDYGGNVLRHGPVDQLEVTARSSGKKTGEAPAKECPNCHSVIAAGYSVCPDCGHAFPPPEKQNHDAQATAAGILSDQFTLEEYEVHDEYYSDHKKRGADENHPRTFRVDYLVGFQQYQSEFLCFDHKGWPRKKAERWWRERSDIEPPDSVEEAVTLARDGALRSVSTITVRYMAGDKYGTIVGYQFGERVEPEYDEEEIPF